MAIRNPTTGTKVDDEGVLSLTSTRITGADVDANVEAYLYWDDGVDYYNAIDTYFEVYVDNASQDLGSMAMGFSDTIDDLTGWEADSLVLLSRKYINKYRAFLFRGYGVASDYGDYNLNQLYYWHIVRTAGNDTVNAYIYSDSSHTTLVDTLTVSGYSTAKWRYLYGASSQNYGTDNRNFDGYIQNIVLNGAVASTITSAVSIGILSNATRISGYRGISNVIVGIVAGASRKLAAQILSSVSIGVTSTATRLFKSIRNSIVVVGVTTTASRIFKTVVPALVLIGVVTSASKAWGVRVLSSVLIGVTSNATRGFNSLKNSAVVIGVGSTASRIFKTIVPSSVIVGIITSASRAWGVRVLSAISVGVSSTANRVYNSIKTSSVIVGIATTASRIFKTSVSSSVVIGAVASAIRVRGARILSVVSIGVATTASKLSFVNYLANRRLQNSIQTVLRYLGVSSQNRATRSGASVQGTNRKQGESRQGISL